MIQQFHCWVHIWSKQKDSCTPMLIAALFTIVMIWKYPSTESVQFSSVTQSCLTLCDPMNCSMPSFPVLHYLSEFAQTHVHWVSDAIQPSNSLSPLSVLPSIFPSIRVFSNELVLQIRWLKYWSFSFSVSPSNEYSGLISFRIDSFWSPCCNQN